MEKERETMDSKPGILHKVLTWIGVVLCVVFSFLLVCNLTIIIKGTIHPETPPSVFGTTPMVVLSGSMSGTADGHIEAGDLIFVGKTNVDELRKGDIIAFMEEGSTAVVTHRIVDVNEDSDGKLLFTTKGDANNTEDLNPVREDRVVGIYKSRIPKVGDFALFLHEPLGMVLFIAVPLLIFIIYDIIRRQRFAKKENENIAAMEAEIERLKAAAGEKGGN